MHCTDKTEAKRILLLLWLLFRYLHRFPVCVRTPTAAVAAFAAISGFGRKAKPVKTKTGNF